MVLHVLCVSSVTWGFLCRRYGRGSARSPQAGAASCPRGPCSQSRLRVVSVTALSITRPGLAETPSRSPARPVRAGACCHVGELS